MIEYIEYNGYVTMRASGLSFGWKFSGADTLLFCYNYKGTFSDN